VRCDQSIQTPTPSASLSTSQDPILGAVRFSNVRFQYPSRPDVQVLNDFNLEVSPRQTVALVGKSGSGKSTVLALLQRFYDVSGGSVLVDGQDIRSFDPVRLHEIIAVVPQEPVLFSDSIRSNIRCARLFCQSDLVFLFRSIRRKLLISYFFSLLFVHLLVYSKSNSKHLVTIISI